MAVRRVREGEQPSEVMKSYGLCRTTIYRWLRAAERNGEAALASRKHPGRQFTLTEKQMKAVRVWICGKDPRQYAFDFGLWTRKIVAQLIERKFRGRGVVVGALAEPGVPAVATGHERSPARAT